MAEIRKRRIVSPVVGVALLIATYIGSFATIPYFEGRGTIDRETAQTVDGSIYVPLAMYQWSGLPGSGYLSSVRRRWLAVGSEQRRQEIIRDGHNPDTYRPPEPVAD
ncbi:MAG: hypothetical protein U0992_17555 [Planctomycetaceae bacterium]